MNISFDCVMAALFAFAPAYETTDPVVLARYLALYNMVRCQVNAAILSCCGCTAMAFLIAHYLYIAANPTTGIVSDLKEGDLSIGYNVSPDMNALLLSPYGRMYTDLINRTIVGSFVTNLPPVLGGVIQPLPPGGCGNANGYGAGWGFGNGGCCG